MQWRPAVRENFDSGRDIPAALPIGSWIVSKPTARSADSPGPTQPNEFIEQDVPTKTKKVWYVLLERVTPPPAGKLFGTTYEKSWRFAHTKKWARDQARAAELEGWKVIDIFPGTKEHISHKYRGL
jgi:hypothetical protein